MDLEGLKATLEARYKELQKAIVDAEAHTNQVRGAIMENQFILQTLSSEGSKEQE